MTSNGRVARLTALALATGTLVAAGVGSASAATATKDVFNAAGGGSVLHIELNLPVALPSIGDKITQDLVLTGSNVRTSSFTTPAAAVTKSILGANGNIPVVSEALDKALTATYGTPNPASQGTFPANPLISGGVLQLTSETANPDVAGQIAHSLSSVANLRVEGAGNLQAVLDALTAQLTTVLNGVVGTLPTGAPAQQVAGVTTTVTDLLGSVVTQVNTATNGAAQPVKDAVDAVIVELNALPQLLAQQIKLKTADTSLLSVGLIQSEQTVSRTADVVTSEATNKLTGISALGGLVTVDGMTSTASASLGKNVSDAASDGTSSVLKVNVADLLSVDVTGKLTAVLGGSAVPAAVKDAVNGALATITGVLNERARRDAERPGRRCPGHDRGQVLQRRRRRPPAHPAGRVRQAAGRHLAGARHRRGHQDHGPAGHAAHRGDGPAGAGHLPPPHRCRPAPHGRGGHRSARSRAGGPPPSSGPHLGVVPPVRPTKPRSLTGAGLRAVPGPTRPVGFVLW